MTRFWVRRTPRYGIGKGITPSLESPTLQVTCATALRRMVRCCKAGKSQPLQPNSLVSIFAADLNDGSVDEEEDVEGDEEM